MAFFRANLMCRVRFKETIVLSSTKKTLLPSSTTLIILSYLSETFSIAYTTLFIIWILVTWANSSSGLAVSTD